MDEQIPDPPNALTVFILLLINTALVWSDVMSYLTWKLEVVPVATFIVAAALLLLLWIVDLFQSIGQSGDPMQTTRRRKRWR